MKNRTYINRIAAVAITVTVAVQLNAQDYRFTNQYNNPLRLNPGLMGMNQDLKLIANYRNQWGSVGGYETAVLSVMYPIFVGGTDEKIDLGLNVMNDESGAFSAIDISLAVGYSLKVSETGNLSFALQGGYVMNSVNTADLTWGEQYNGKYDSSIPTTEVFASDIANHPDMGFGLLWDFQPSRDNDRLKAWVGVSGFHLNEPERSLLGNSSILPRKFSYQVGVKMIGEQKVDLSPGVIVTTQGGSKEVAGGVNIDFRVDETTAIRAGTWYRQDDALAFQLGLKYNALEIGYGYDMTNSPLSRAVSGLSTHEIILSFQFNTKGSGTSAPSMDKPEPEKKVKEPKEKKVKEPKEKKAKEKKEKPEKEKKVKEPKEKKKKEKEEPEKE